MQQCLEFLHENNYYIIFDVKRLIINACFRHSADAIFHLRTVAVREIHRLIEPSAYPPLSFESLNLEDFPKISTSEAIELFESNKH